MIPTGGRCLVWGDAILDRFTYCSKLGISAETPTVVGRWERDEASHGGAALVARNLVALGCDVRLATFDHAAIIDGMENVCIRADRCGAEKHRFFVDDYKLLQIDRLPTVSIEAYGAFCDLERALRARKYDALLICDNRHGAIPEQAVAADVVDLCTREGIRTYVDSQLSQKEPNHDWYVGADVVFMNEKEYRYHIDRNGFTMAELVGYLGVDELIVKRGAKGVSRLKNDWGFTEVPGIDVNVVDTCGAGDAFMAAYVASGGDLSFANRWAARSVELEGTQVPKLEDIPG